MPASLLLPVEVAGVVPTSRYCQSFPSCSGR